MWSFVVQNFYQTPYEKTRKNLSLKKLSVTPYLNVLLKYNSTTYSLKLLSCSSNYYRLYSSGLKLAFWKYFSTLVMQNQGITVNNITLSCTFHTLVNLNTPESSFALSLHSMSSRAYTKTTSLVSLPFYKTTYNLLVYLNYLMLTSIYFIHPMWFNINSTYTWVSSHLHFDIMLNTFYFKVYKY